MHEIHISTSLILSILTAAITATAQPVNFSEASLGVRIRDTDQA
jgi:hypothetical protein